MLRIKYLIQGLWILYFYAIGAGVSFLIGGIIPGSVLGMMMLFGALSLGWIRSEAVEDVSRLLIKYMVLFFLPAAVGVMTVWRMVADNLWAIVVASMLSTVFIVAIVGVLQQKIGKRW